MKVSKLAGAALDWAVAKCEGEEIEYFNPLCSFGVAVVSVIHGVYSPSTDWAQGGPIVERDKISVWARGNEWAAESFIPNHKGLESVGPTPLVAAMRCYVASKMGDEIELPEELK